jgi:hypothetical protein
MGEFETMSFCEIHIFEYDSVDGIDGHLQYNNVVFRLQSLDQYDGYCIEVYDDWKLVIWGDEGIIVKEFYIMENDEFRAKLYMMYPLKG